MPGALDAGTMVSMVQDELQVWSPNVLRPGFPDDPPDPVTGQPYTSTSIIRYLNEAQRQLAIETGYTKCRLAMTLVPGTWEYTLVQGAAMVEDATLQLPGLQGFGKTLKRTTLGKLDLISPSWQDPTTQVQGCPTKYYTTAQIIGFVPTPDQAYTCYLLTDTLTSDLVYAVDVPSIIPNMYMHGLVAYAALKLNGMIDLENPLSVNRVADLKGEWQKTIEEVDKITNQRGDDYDGNVTVMDYRKHFMVGVAS